MADHLDCSLDRLARIEAGSAPLRLSEAREMLDLYRVHGEARAGVLRMVQHAGRSTWWYPHADIVDGEGETLLVLEDEAGAIRIHQPGVVPGLLQTRRYAWELMTAVGDVPLETVERRVDLLLGRQRILARLPAPRIAVVLDEASLLRVVGDDVLMKEQYDRLIEIAHMPTAELRVLPLDAGPYRALGSAFQIFGFHDGAPQVIQMRLLDCDLVTEHEPDVGRYIDAFEDATSLALDPEESLAFLRTLSERS